MHSIHGIFGLWLACVRQYSLAVISYDTHAIPSPSHHHRANSMRAYAYTYAKNTIKANVGYKANTHSTRIVSFVFVQQFSYVPFAVVAPTSLPLFILPHARVAIRCRLPVVFARLRIILLIHHSVFELKVSKAPIIAFKLWYFILSPIRLCLILVLPLSLSVSTLHIDLATFD